MFQYHLKKHSPFSYCWLTISKYQHTNIQEGKNVVNLEQQRFLNWMFPKYCVFLSFGDDFKRHKSNPLDFQVQAYHFCASYQWCGEEREYIIQLHFGKKYMFYFLCHFATFHVCWHAQWYKALLLQEWPLHSSVATFIGNMQIQCSIKILKDFNSESKGRFQCLKQHSTRVVPWFGVWFSPLNAPVLPLLV